MASSNNLPVTHSKRPHVKTERMQEFIRSQGEASSPTKRLKCPEACCEKVFTSSPGLKYHLQTHCVRDPQYSCRKCNKVFKSANGLKYHREKTKCDDSDMQSHFGTFQGQDISDVCDISDEHAGASVSRGLPKFLDLSSAAANAPVRSFAHGALSSRDPLEPLELSPGGGMDKLTELAIIATSPQSPLMQKPKPPWETKPSAAVRSLDQMFNSFDKKEAIPSPATPPTTPSFQVAPQFTDFSDSGGVCDSQISSTICDSQVTSSFPVCSSPEDETWPTPVWQCFVKGTKVKFCGGTADWQQVEVVAQREDLSRQATVASAFNDNRYAPDGLRIKVIQDGRDDGDEADIRILFSPGVTDQPDLWALCHRDHPFFVKDKGWSSRHPCEAVVRYGIPCTDLCVDDVCVPPAHTENSFSEEVFLSSEESDFTPEYTSAVLALSNMKQRKDFDLSPPPGSPQPTKTEGPDGAQKPKRPMNAFMLFAKTVRHRYTQKFPHRDNRAISVMLGECWKNLAADKKKVYEQKAKLLARKQQKVHPDCWKRKK